MLAGKQPDGARRDAGELAIDVDARASVAFDREQFGARIECGIKRLGLDLCTFHCLSDDSFRRGVLRSGRDVRLSVALARFKFRERPFWFVLGLLWDERWGSSFF